MGRICILRSCDLMAVTSGNSSYLFPKTAMVFNFTMIVAKRFWEANQYSIFFNRKYVIPIFAMFYLGAWNKTAWWRWKGLDAPWCSATTNFARTFPTSFLKHPYYQRRSLLCQRLICKNYRRTHTRRFIIRMFHFKHTQHTFPEVLILAQARVQARMHRAARWACLLKRVRSNLFTLIDFHMKNCSLKLKAEIWIAFGTV